MSTNDKDANNDTLKRKSSSKVEFVDADVDLACLARWLLSNGVFRFPDPFKDLLFDFTSLLPLFHGNFFDLLFLPLTNKHYVLLRTS